MIVILTLHSLYGDSEELIGKWFKRTGKRDEIFIATKFGFVKGSKTYAIDSSAEYAKKSCAESLRLLDIDCIDLCEYSTPTSHFQGFPGFCLGKTQLIVPSRRPAFEFY